MHKERKSQNSQIGPPAKRQATPTTTQFHTAEQHRLIVENLHEYAIFSLDRQGFIVTWNRGAERITGYSEEEALGQHAALLFTPEDRADKVPAREMKQALRTGQARDERWHVGRNGDRFWASGILTTLLDTAGELQGFVKILRDDTKRKEAAETLEIAKEQLEQRVQERTTELELSNMMLVDQIMERRRAEEELRQRNQELATLNDFSTVVSGSLELADTFNSLYRLLAEQMKIPGGALFLYDAIEDDVQLQSSWGFPSHFLADFQSFPLADCYFEPVVREQKVLLHQDFREVSLFLGLRLDESRPDWRSFLCVPLLAKGEVQGVFGLFCQAPNNFQAEQIGFFQTLGQQVGIAIYNARLFAEVKTSREKLQLLASKVVQAQEEERRRVSRELHDEAGQSLTGLLLHLEMMRGQLDEGPPIRTDDVAEAIQITSETMESIRRLAHGLRPPALDTVGLNRVLEAMCQDMARRAQITIHYEGVELAALPDPITVSFYRVLQEALTNITKHAQATQVDVRLQQENGHISLLIVDNGCGFTAAPDDDLGIGLTGMQERLQMLGGVLRIRSQSGGGVELKALVPLAL